MKFPTFRVQDLYPPKADGGSTPPALQKDKAFRSNTGKRSGCFMTFSVYVLFSSSHKKTYIGYTSDLNNRLLSHNFLATKGYTLRYRPWVLIYKENFATKSEALKREKELKSGQGRRFVWQLINEIPNLRVQDLYPPKADGGSTPPALLGSKSPKMQRFQALNGLTNRLQSVWRNTNTIVRSNLNFYSSIILRFEKLVRCEITNDNFSFKIKISHRVFLPEVGTTITFFFPNMKPARLMFHLTATKLLKKWKNIMNKFLAGLWQTFRF